ncbi:MAG: hypothetical protein KAH18_12795 [Psychromonas sp.]|nr:hypothetical protein [Psychromonas sp.]
MIPVAFKLMTKEIQYSDVVTRKIKRKSSITKNEDLIFILKACNQNQLKWRYVFDDSFFINWQYNSYSLKMKKHFIFALKNNRLIALSRENKLQWSFHRIDSLDWP